MTVRRALLVCVIALAAVTAACGRGSSSATDSSSGVAVVSKSGFSVGNASGTPLSITADDRGYIALNFTWGFDVVDPDGNGQEDGGGTASFINQRNGWIQN